MNVLQFWAKMKEAPSGCWEWQGTCNRERGYGWLRFQGKPWLTHRLAWRLTFGDIPEGKQVLHKCDNPPCCNPYHLFLGDALINAKDRDEKGRSGGRSLPGEKNPEAKLTEAIVLKILSAEGYMYQIADKYGISKTQVWNIKHRRNWKHVTPPNRLTTK